VDTPPDGVAAREMVVQRLVGQRDQLPMAAVGALDAGLLADACAPFVGTRRRVAARAGLALPAHGIDIGAPPKQAAEERDLFFRGQRGRRGLLDLRCGFFSPGNAVRIEHACKSSVFGTQPKQFTHRGVRDAVKHERLSRPQSRLGQATQQGAPGGMAYQ
jgi:hypothetical protein